MARGRFISKAVITDRGINNLSNDTSRLAFTWLITLADCEGRTAGEPDLLKSALFPRRSDITPDQIRDFITEWMISGFIIWYYGADGDRYIQFINFEKHQVGLRKNREAASEIDDPANCRSVDGLTPEEIGLRLRLSKDKGKEEGLLPDEEPDSPSSPLEAAFVEATNINGLLPSPEVAFQAYKAMQDAGVIPEDIHSAVRILQKKKYIIVGPSSVLNTAISEMSRRTSTKNKERELLRGYTHA